MNEYIPTLLKLQELEIKRYEFQTILDQQVPQAKKLKEPWVDIKTSIDEKKARIKKMKVEQSQIELEIETRNQSISRLEVQRFETKKNEEFTAMGHEIHHYQDEVDELETELLSKLDIIEKLEKKFQSEFELATKMRPQIEQELELFKQKLANAKAEVVELESAIAHLEKKLPEETTQHWHRLIKNKAGLKNVVLFNAAANLCPACNMNVQPQVKIDIAHDENLVMCPSCSSFLYLEDDYSE